jgi:hypothetical protein
MDVLIMLGASLPRASHGRAERRAGHHSWGPAVWEAPPAERRAPWSVSRIPLRISYVVSGFSRTVITARPEGLRYFCRAVPGAGFRLDSTGLMADG